MSFIRRSKMRNRGKRWEGEEDRGEGRGKNTDVPYTFFVTMETE